MTPLRKNVWLWAFLIGVVLVTLMRPLLRRVPAPPPVLAQLPAFDLVEAGGERFRPVDLEGSVWVLAFFSTRSDAACRGLIESMIELGRRYDEAGVAEVRLLGINVDPAEAMARLEAVEPVNPAAPVNPAVPVDLMELPADDLRELGKTRGLARPRWSLAIGDREETRRLADALLEATGQSLGPAGFQGGVPRPCRLFLIDGAGGIRGAYRDNSKGLDEVFHRAQHVAGLTVN